MNSILCGVVPIIMPIHHSSGGGGGSFFALVATIITVNLGFLAYFIIRAICFYFSKERTQKPYPSYQETEPTYKKLLNYVFYDDYLESLNIITLISIGFNAVIVLGVIAYQITESILG